MGEPSRQERITLFWSRVGADLSLHGWKNGESAGRSGWAVAEAFEIADAFRKYYGEKESF